MPTKDDFSVDLEKVEGLSPSDLMWTTALHKDGKMSVGVVDFDGSNGRDFNAGMERVLALHRASIYVVRDHPKVTDAINQLLEIAVGQEQRISALETELEKVRSEKIAVAVQDQARALTENLADRGYATGAQKFTVKVEEEATDSSQSRTERSAESARVADVKGKIKGLAKFLTGLEVAVNVRRESVERALDEASNASRQSKKVNLTWEIEAVTPPEDPKAHAHAFRLRTSNEPMQQSATGTDRFWRAIALLSLAACAVALLYVRVGA